MLSWKTPAENIWKADISPDSYFQIIKENDEYKLSIVSDILMPNNFDLPFESLEAAREKANDLYSIFEEMLKSS